MHPGTPDRCAPGVPPDPATRSADRGLTRIRRRPRAALLAAALFGSLGLLLSACGGSGSHPAAGASLSPSPGSSLPGMPGASGTAGSPSMPGMSPGMTMPSSSGAPADAGAPAATGNAVMIKGFAFAPAALTVKAGTTVTWTNQDSDAHTVTSTGSGGPLNSKALATGDTFSYTFSKTGTYKYLCTIHPFMTATVTVTA
jgi:plastocyanin